MNSKTDATIPQTPEFSRVVSAAELTTGETNIDFEATPAELAALTTRLGVKALKALKGRTTLQILPNGDVLMEMHFSAHVSQHCVVTLAPIETDVVADFTTTYSENADEDWGHDEEEFEDLDTDIEPPEPLIEGKIDLGEACVEQLALEIDPFPRVQGATFDGYSAGSHASSQGADAGTFEKKNPFAVLSKLKTPKENDK